MALEERVVDRLIRLGYTVSFAESCTGGLCCGTLVNVANASKVLNASFVTYANAAKFVFGRGGGHDLELWRSQRAGGGANGTGRG